MQESVKKRGMSITGVYGSEGDPAKSLARESNPR